MGSGSLTNQGVFLTPSEVASALGVSPNTVTRWAREGRVPHQMTLGGHRRFEAHVVEELRQRLQENGPAPSGGLPARPAAPKENQGLSKQ